MQRPKSFTHETFQEIAFAIEEAVSDLGDRLGVSIALGKKNFNSLKGEIGLSLRILDANGKPEKPWVTDYKLYMPIHGLRMKDLGTTFKVNKTTYKLLGYNPNRQMRPFVAENLKTGKKAALGEAFVQRALLGVEPAASVKYLHQ